MYSWNQVIVGITIQNLQGSNDRKLGSIDQKSCISNFLQKSQTSPSSYDVWGFVFHSKYERKNPSYVLEVFVELCVESFMRSERCLPAYIHIELSRLRFTSRT